MLRRPLLLLLSLLPLLAIGQTVSERAAVRLTATVQASPAAITLNWVSISSTTSLNIYRKLKSATSWGTAVATPAATATSWTDNTVSVGTNYEYKVVRVSSGVTGTGYISSGIQVPVVDYRGKIILLVDNTLASSLANELTTLTNDLRGDGWAVLRTDVSRTASVTSIRTIVQNHYNSDPSNVKALYLIGHVPVPYSGNITPDGHDDGRGARPTDGYYADVNGTWTDNTVNVTVSTHVPARNIPGDGKFDQSDFPSTIELQVGRVDLYDMPAFGTTEVELMRSYLNRAHNYKVKAWSPTVRALLIDNLQWVGSPLAGSGWRTAPLVGPTSPAPAAPVGAFSSYINNQSYLWTYHCGGGLQALDGTVVTYNGTDGGATTQQMASSVTMGGVFNMAMGSFFYDFDNRNNFLRAVIARGDGLTNCWAGIPAWYFHHMGLGENIGYGVLQTMNNTGLYTPLTEGWQATIGRSHLNLMGDPSLRMKMVKPPSNLVITNASGTAAFSWTASTEAVSGYHLYQLDASTGAITRLTTNPVTSTSYSNGAIPFVAGRQYMVRAMVLETNYSGSYYNLSLGAIGTASGSATADCLGVVGGTATVGSACNDNNACTINDVYNASCQCVGTSITPAASITANGSTAICGSGSVVLSANTGAGYSYVWKRNGTTISGATASSYTATLAGTYIVTVTSSGCSATSAGAVVTTSTTPTATITNGTTASFCTGGSVVLNAATGTGYTYSWTRNGTTISGATASSYAATLAGTYAVRVSLSGCSATSATTTVSAGTMSTPVITAGGSTTFCTGGSVTLSTAQATGNTYQWKRNGVAISGATSASYASNQTGAMTVTVTNGSCSATSNAVSVTVNSTPAAIITAGGSTSFCNGGSVVLSANTGTGLTYVWRKDGTTISGATTSAYTATTAGTYTVVVSNGGCSATSAGAVISVSAFSVPVITATGTTALCSGSSVTLTTGQVAGNTYQWLRNGAAVSGATSYSYTTNLAGTYTVSKSNGSCSATSSAVTVTVGGAPTATITAGGATTFCSGGGVLLTATSGTGYTYSWRRNGTAISGATAGTYSATLAGSYTVVITSGSCSTTSNTVTVTVPTTPSATITASGATGFCTGGSVVLSATTGTGLTYSWRRNGTAISGATTSSYTANTAGSYTVVVSNGTCSATSTGVTVSVNPQPSAVITPAGPTTVCSGGSVTLNASTGTGYTYVWFRGGVAITNATGTSYVATQSGSYTLLVNNNGCTKTSSAVVVTVNTAPTASCSSNVSASTVTVVASGGLAPYTYSWNTSPVKTTATASVTASGTYTVVVTDARGCTATCNTTITLPTGAECAGIRTETQSTWGATASGSNPAAYLASNFATAFPAPGYLSIGCGTRILRLTSAAAVTAFLPSTGTAARLPYGTTTNPTTYGNSMAGELVALKISVRLDELSSSFSPSSVRLKDMEIASGTFTGWTVQALIDAADAKIGSCGGTYSRTTLNDAIIAINQGYAGGTLASGYLVCPGSGMVEEPQQAINTISPELQPEMEVTLYPNPTNGPLNVVIEKASAGHGTSIELTGLHGAVVMERQLGDLPEGIPHQITLDLNGLRSGVYFLRVINGDRTTTGKVLVD